MILFLMFAALLNCNILELLVIVGRDYQADTDIMCLVLKILANISRDKEASAQLIRDTGKQLKIVCAKSIYRQ